MTSSIERSQKEPTHLRVLLADGLPVAYESFRRELSGLTFVQMVGEAKTCDEALSLLFRLRPDAVIASATLPEQGGFELLRCVHRAAADCAVILASPRANPFIEQTAELLGAAGIWATNQGFLQLKNLLQAVWDRKTAR